MNFKLGIYEKNAISIHTGLNLSLVRNRLKHGKCYKCGRNNPCKNIQILCPESGWKWGLTGRFPKLGRT